MDPRDEKIIRQLFDDYLRMYSSRDDRLTTHFSEDFSGFTGGGDVLVKNREEWVAITRQDFAQIKNPIRIELKDLAIQSLADTVAVATGFFTIHLPLEDHILSKEVARLVLIFRLESSGWKISHSSISIPYHLVREGEIYPMQELENRNQFLENLVAERTDQLSHANDNLQQANEKLAREIENHKQTESALRQEQLLSKSIIDSLPGIFYLYTYPELKLILWNREHESLFGYEIGEIEGRHVTDWHAPESEDAVLGAIEDVMAKGRASIEAHLLTKDGRSVPLILTGIRFETQGQLYLMGIGIDITERKRAEAEAEKLQNQLIQSQKMESVGRLAGGVAHDFNNMLGVILGYTEIVLKKETADQPMSSALRGIQQAAQRSADLTRQLLAFARKQTVAPKVLDLNETVASMLIMLRRLIGENIDLVWLPDENLGAIKMDYTQIDQILANLCVNARDAIGDTGRITIETGNVILDEAYCASHVGFAPGEYVLLMLSDNGCGMDRETISHLFEPFFTTKEMGKGTGLGLATVYGIVKQNDGFIYVYSELGLGTTFKVYLPRHKAKDEKLPEPEETELVTTEHETILLVEDEPMILEMTTVMLELQGYTVLPANSAVEAISLAREYAGKIHLLMTDVVMPEMNGRDLARNLLPLYPHLKRLFMSGYTANVIAHHGVLDEGVHFLQKPFTMQDLATKIRAVMGENDPGQV
ncbi:MAG: nuclear transport factor 2 family protein [Desulfobulbus sp.]|nr:nuclear transport factor 2 family protein [Desulfobulbus sp.]